MQESTLDIKRYAYLLYSKSIVNIIDEEQAIYDALRKSVDEQFFIKTDQKSKT
jgi:hypothetical protein